ncbi:hypothetical protein Lal_00041899 [Lupinus albus]|nr:hypothetical protein Lal_00041899 [Lupinus albus]
MIALQQLFPFYMNFSIMDSEFGFLDRILSVTGTKYSIKKMNLTTKTTWYPWLSNEEVGGYTEVYEGDLTFTTVRET